MLVEVQTPIIWLIYMKKNIMNGEEFIKRLKLVFSEYSKKLHQFSKMIVESRKSYYLTGWCSKMKLLWFGNKFLENLNCGDDTN